MNNGDWVIAVPASETLAETYETVTGQLQITPAEFMGEVWSVYTVIAKYKDGSDAPIEVREDSIEPASPRRSQPSILEVRNG